MNRRRLRIEKAARQQQILRRYAQQRSRNRLAEPGPLPLVVILDGLKAGYNVAKIFRSAFAMGATGIHLVNIGPFDPAPAKGAFRKVPAHFHDDFDSAYELLHRAGYRFFALSPTADVALSKTDLPVKSAFIFGHEARGLSFSAGAYPAMSTLRIPQVGPIDSLNVSVAASITMYEYVRQHGD